MFTNRLLYLSIVIVVLVVTACSPQVAVTAPISSTAAFTPIMETAPVIAPTLTAQVSPTLEVPPLEFKGHTGVISDVDFSPDGKYLVTGSNDQTARLWDLATGETVGVFSGYTVAFSPDGKTLATGSADHTVRLWDVASGETVQVFSDPTNEVGYVEFSPDGKFIMSGGSDPTARIWDVTTGQTVHLLAGHSEYLTRIAYSPDGQYVLTGSGDDTARLWDAATGEELRVFSGHTADVSSVAFSPDGKQIATGDERTVRLWDAETGKIEREFSGHQSWISGIEFASNGEFLITCSGDRTSRLWSVATGETIRIFNESRASLQDVTFSPDGEFIAAVGDDRVARVWTLQSTSTTASEQNTSSITLHLAVADAPGRPSEPYVLEFIEQVKNLSNGQIIIEPIWQAGDDTPAGFESGVIQHVMQGDMELGISASRAFDTQSVTSFQALQAPFLITNDTLAEAVAASDIATRMLKNASSAGIVGLTLWPEDLRHPFSVVPGEKILSPEDFAGLSVRATPSILTYQMLEAFGASPMMGDTDYQAAESGLRQGFSLTGTPTATGNVVFFPKFQVLFANGATFEKLSKTQQDTLREAAIATQMKAIAEHPREVEAATAWCTDGGTVVMASNAQVAAFEAAAQPVFAALEADPLNARLIADIRELKGKTESSPGASACVPESGLPNAGTDAEAQSWSTGAPPTGVWRVELSADDFARMGVLHSVAESDWAGTFEYVFEDGKGTHRAQGKTWTLVCPFTTEVIEDLVRISFVDLGLGNYDCGAESDDVRWRLDADGLHFKLIANHGGNKQVELTAMYEAKPWQKVEIWSEGLPPNGVWQVELTSDDFVGMNVMQSKANQMAGTYTWTLQDGNYILLWEDGAGQSGNCIGTYAVVDDFVRLTSTTQDCPGEVEDLQWRLDDDGLRVHLLATKNIPFTEMKANFEAKPWQKIEQWSQGLPPNGVWQVELTVEDFVQMGVLRSVAEAEWAGTYTLTLKDGKSLGVWQGLQGQTGKCQANYEVVEDFVRFTYYTETDECLGEVDDLQWRLDGEGLHFHVVDIENAPFTEIKAYLEAKPWQKIADP